MPEKSEHKNPWQLAIEQLIGVFFTAMLIALVLDDPEHECLFAALKYTAAIYLFTWAYKILRWLFGRVCRWFWSPREIFRRLYLRGLAEMYLRRVKNFFAR